MNGGQMKYFVDLSKENVWPLEVLNWNSSIEMVDNYAAVYHNNHSLVESGAKENFLCCSIHRSTFGKYCEYEPNHEVNFFEASHSSQVHARWEYEPYSQYYGHIVCYKTLSCNLDLLCLDRQDICDDKQQCEDGWHEENCDKLEFNECEEDEFRCTNGMCVPKEYWLDDECKYWLK
jgi:hypothetical protein